MIKSLRQQISVHPQIQSILVSDIPDIFLEHTEEWNYYIIGGRAYNLLMKIPVATVDYDVKFDVPFDKVISIRNYIAKKLIKKYPNITINIDDKPELARITATADGIEYDILDCGVVGEEHIKEKYDIRQNYVVGPNGLRYGGLGYLLIRLEELTKLREQEVNTIIETREEYLSISNQIYNLILSKALVENVSNTILDDLKKYIENYGKSSESDTMIGEKISQILENITDDLITKYQLDDTPDYDSFINSSNKKTWINKKRPNGMNFNEPLDVVITLFYAEDLYMSSNVINADLDSKLDKYNRTKDRLKNLKDGLTDPYKYYSNFFIELLKKMCTNKQSIKLFLIDTFNCGNISK